MINFSQFLKESENFDLEKFKKDCAPFLELLKGTKGKVLLYRGDKHPPFNFTTRVWKERKAPVDTPLIIHNRVNEYFNEKYGKSFRNWMFGTGDIGVARAFGTITAIFPIGELEWFGTTSQEFDDLTLLHNNIWYDMKQDLQQQYDMNKDAPYLSPTQEYKISGDRLIKEIKSVHWDLNKNLIKLLKSTNEVMFKCKEYYVFNISFGENHETFLDEVKPFLDTL